MKYDMAWAASSIFVLLSFVSSPAKNLRAHVGRVCVYIRLRLAANGAVQRTCLDDGLHGLLALVAFRSEPKQPHTMEFLEPGWMHCPS
jgi:hypothetical protein